MVERVLLDLVPRKLLLDPDDARAVPDAMRSFVAFAALRSGLADTARDQTLDSIDHMEEEYHDLMTDPGSAGPAKAVMQQLLDQGVDLSDIDAVNEALGALTADAAVPALGSTERTQPSPALVAAASQTVALQRLQTVADFYGPRRKLTKTGNPTLADARELVALLPTGDRFDAVIGDRTFKTKSAAELPELSFTLAWAIKAGAVRKIHGKLQATAAWKKLEAKPMERWLRTVDALVDMRPLGTYRSGAYAAFSQMAEFVDDHIPVLLRLPDPDVAYDLALDLVCDNASAAFVWDGGYLADPTHRRQSLASLLDLLLIMFDWAGLTQRVGADTAESDDIVLTELGRWWRDGA